MGKKIFILLIFTVIASLAIYYVLPETKLPSNTNVDKLLVLKSRKQLLVYAKGKLVKTYTISLGFLPKGKKEFENDGKTPEGSYFINAKNPNSVCYKNLGISYPNKADIAHAKQLNQATGGDIKIHGLSNGKGFIGKFQRWYNWTNGCVALTNYEMNDLYQHTAIGTLIEIKP
jgi:murein L,D-transpeptidase YafK